MSADSTHEYGEHFVLCGDATKEAFLRTTCACRQYWETQESRFLTDENTAVIACNQTGYECARAELVKCGYDIPPRHCLAVQGKKILREDAVSEQNRKVLPLLLTARAHQCLESPRESFFDLHNASAVGCFLSHCFVWSAVACDSVHDHMIVFEEDICCPQKLACNVRFRINKLIENAGGPNNFDILMLSANSTWWHGGPEIIVDDNFDKKGGLVQTKGPVQCAQAYVVTKRGARKLLATALPISAVADGYLWYIARSRSDFVLLRPKAGPLFTHSVFNFYGSTIGYSLFETLSILVPVQFRLYLATICATIAFLVIMLQ